LSQPRQFRLLTLHFGLYQFSCAMAGGFAGAYLLQQGLSLPQALASFAALLAVRFVLRCLSLVLVRRVGVRGAMMAGAAILATQFWPLIHARDPLWLALWLFIVALGESLYWPCYHSAVAVTGAPDSRGRELGLRNAIGAMAGITGPLVGGVLLQRFGPAVDFGLAAGITLAAIPPLLLMAPLKAGEIPSLREALRTVDRRSLKAFAADGYISGGLMLAWPMALFVSLGSQYESLGVANALASLVGAGVGLVAGRVIDAGRRDRALVWVSLALVASFAFRAFASWSPLAAHISNATGAAVIGVYTTVLMSLIYDRAKGSGAAYRFHFAMEGGWDAGAALGCLAGAAAALATGVPSLATLPSVLGVGVMYLCVRGGKAPATEAASA
jgi:MFS family permease